MAKKRKSNVIGLRPVPPDVVLEDHIKEVIVRDENVLNGQLELLADAIETSDPYVFAYARLLNFLASDTLSKTELVHLCAAAMWGGYTEDV